MSFAVDHVEKTCLVPETAPDIRLFFGKGECQPISWGNLMLNHWIFARHTDTTSPTFQPLPLMLANSWPSRRPHRMTQNQRAKIQDPNLTPRQVKRVGIAKWIQVVDMSSSFLHLHDNLGVYPCFSIVGQSPIVQDLQLSRTWMRKKSRPEICDGKKNPAGIYLKPVQP